MGGWFPLSDPIPFLFYLGAAACIGGVFSLSTSNTVNSIPYVHPALPSHSPPFTSYLHPSSNASSKTHSRFHCPHWHMEEEHPHTPSSTLSISGLWNRHQRTIPRRGTGASRWTNQFARRSGSPMKWTPQNEWRIGTSVIGLLKFRRDPLFWCGHSLFFS